MDKRLTAILLAWFFFLLVADDGFSVSDASSVSLGQEITQLHNRAMKLSLSGERRKAIACYKKALALAKRSGKKELVAVEWKNIGWVYSGAGRYDKAVQSYERALSIQREIGSPEITNTLFALGGLYQGWCYKDRTKCDKAIEILKKAGGPLQWNSIGQVYFSLGMHHGETAALEKAVDCFEQALETAPSAFHGLIVSNIAEAYYALKDYAAAIPYLERAVELRENRRLSARGIPDVALITSYMLLTSAYIKENRPGAAFDTVEEKTAGHLCRQFGKGESSLAGINEYQKTLNAGTAVIRYAYMRNPLGYQYNTKKVKPVLIFVDRQNINGYELSKYETVERIKEDEPAATRFLQEIKQLNVKGDIQPMDDRERRDDVIRPKDEQALHHLFKQTEFSMVDFNIGGVLSEYELDAIIIYYRNLLTRPALSKEEKEALEGIGKALYTFLFGRIEKHLTEKKDLIIIPDGILSFLPFEALIMPDGRFFLEKYHVKYLQSLAVEGVVSKRRYTKERKPLLAFGGGIYEGGHKCEAYRALGIVDWKNLPGTLEEVTALKKIIPNCDVYTGEKVSESHIKKLSKKGELKQYKVIHFATHGVVVPESPELSALVLSRLKGKWEGEDGYLNMKEIAGLEMNADFVNLSACKTGLGKIYRGEGLAGFTQSFLTAGANALCVSLWQVADAPTAEFMLGLYRLVWKFGMTYDRAITEMKRRFLQGAEKVQNMEGSRGLIVKKEGEKHRGEYANPFFWAPFVYYGQ